MYQIPIEKIQRFAERRGKVEEAYDDQPISSAAIQAYNRKLDDTLRELQEQVKRQEDDLRTLRTANAVDFSKIHTDPWARVSEIRRAKKAYDSLLNAETNLPDPSSPLPSLIAAEETSRLVKESKAYVSMTAESLSANRERLKVEEANLRDAQAIRDGLQKRIQKIRVEQSSKVEKTPSQLARDFVEEQEEKKEDLDKATNDLKKTLHAFVDRTLASMLAAEDSGGPTVGDADEISDAVLERGYTSHGKPKKPKSVETNNDSTQLRIDELVPRRSAPGGSQTVNRNNKRETAAAEMHGLLDALLEAGSSYIDLPRESASSRFLVRAKVAQFHPHNAKRLRLIDFGRSLDD
ncbi:hypothetical protein ATEIFO6365_0007039100 [Aspergillus terreus]|uniref:Uncharacterized protein n=1 Tax=Aspergillus terreus TaxID=33178 RepID=A0A5M3Z8I1_ASPTE|nr:hypothetical protein ATETN484_0009039100 [Aspergillus terreus]GFF17842.1 hypothetical protein ATEIFO6365_0007039100 [Aspergillus terreus]